MRSPTVILCAFAILVASSAFAKPHRSETTYEEERSALLKQGLQAVPLTHDASDLVCASDDFCKRYPEVIDCAGTGVNPCLFAYFRPRDREFLVVETYGEEPIMFKAIRPATVDEVETIKQQRR